MENLPADHFVKAHQFVPNVHRDIYPAIDPAQASLSQHGKVVIITGASQGLGARVGVAYRGFFYDFTDSLGVCAIIRCHRRKGHCACRPQ